MYQTVPGSYRREQSTWVPVACGVAAAMGVFALASYALPVHSQSTSMWTATTTKPVAGIRTVPLSQQSSVSRSAEPATVRQASMPVHYASESMLRTPEATSSPLLVGGWVAIGAGLSILALAVHNAMNRVEPVQSVPHTSMAMMATTAYKSPPAGLKLHVYDHCPYCTRVELFLGWNGVKYERVLYGYGDMDGPKFLTGKKMLPALQGEGIYNPQGMIALPESMDIIAFCCKEFGFVLPPTTGRSDIADWQKRAKAPIAALSRPRMIKMPYRDWANPEDIEYAFGKWKKKTGFVADEALAQTPELIKEMETLLNELVPMLKGEASVNPWGLGMDDILLLPDLRRLTCVKDLRWPTKLENYVNKALDYPAMQCVSYKPLAF